MNSLFSPARPTTWPAHSFIGEGVRCREDNAFQRRYRLVARLNLVQATEGELSDKPYRLLPDELRP